MEADWLTVPPNIPAVVQLQLAGEEPANMPKPPEFGRSMKMDSPPATTPPVPMPPQVVTNSPVELPWPGEFAKAAAGAETTKNA